MLASSPVRGPAACTFGFGAVIGFLLGRVAIRRMAATSGGACVSGACVSGAVRHRIARSPRLSIVPAAAKMGKEQQAYAATAGPPDPLLELRLRVLVRRAMQDLHGVWGQKNRTDPRGRDANLLA